MDWEDFRYFSAIAVAGSVRGAAEALAVNASTVTRRLDQFEARLGVRLFTRTRTGLQITPAGAEVVADLEEVAADLGAIERRLLGRDAELAGLLRITLPDMFAIAPLLQDVAGFSIEHPAIKLELRPDRGELDLERREVDIAVRITDEPPGAMVGRRLGSFRLTAYASLDYLARHEPGRDPHGSSWIESGFEAAHASAFKSRHFAALTVGLKCTSLLSQLAAVRASMGVTILPCVLGDSEPTLSRVGSIEPIDAQAVWLLFHPKLRGVARVHAFTEFLQDAFGKLENALLGRIDGGQPTDGN
jgi:DNA-binding transcriptional LysR family regulator